MAAAKTAKEEIAGLKEDVEDLQMVLTRLQRKRREYVSSGGQWKKLAISQSEQRLEAVRENEKLRSAVAECKMAATGLLMLTKRVNPCTRELLSSEESEWKLNILGSHPSRRQYNAHKIMETLLRQISSWSINSGLVDMVNDARYSRCDYRSIPDQPMRVEVVTCRSFNGLYLDIADAVWRYLRRENVVTNTAASVFVDAPEMLTDCIRLKSTRVKSPPGGLPSDHFIHELCQRVEDGTRVVIMWKTVEQRFDAPPPKLADSADGWITFEKAPSNGCYGERCVMKISSTKQVLPVDLMLQRTGHTPMRLIQMMNRAAGYETAARSKQLAPDTIETARNSLADFFIDLLWFRVEQVERVALHAARAPIRIPFA